MSCIALLLMMPFFAFTIETRTSSNSASIISIDPDLSYEYKDHVTIMVKSDPIDCDIIINYEIKGVEDGEVRNVEKRIQKSGQNFVIKEVGIISITFQAVKEGFRQSPTVKKVIMIYLCLDLKHLSNEEEFIFVECVGICDYWLEIKT